MAKNKHRRRFDLRGAETVNAAMMRCGVCKCGDMIGVDLLDDEGRTIAHGHLEIEVAEEFHRLYGEALAEAKLAVALAFAAHRHGSWDRREAVLRALDIPSR